MRAHAPIPNRGIHPSMNQWGGGGGAIKSRVGGYEIDLGGGGYEIEWGEPMKFMGVGL